MELLDVYDDNGKKTGKVVERGIDDSAFEKGRTYSSSNHLY